MLNDEGRGISKPDIFTSYKYMMSSAYTGMRDMAFLQRTFMVWL